MNNARGRAILMSSALASLPRPHVIRRSQSATAGAAPRSVRVVVLGVGGVGKTAMAVRFITKRFIGDYDPTLETIYRHTTVVDDELVNFEIMDTAGQEENSLMLEDKCKWGESFVFVYDVTDKYSFDELTRLKFIASYTHSRLRVNFTPCWILVGNKSDLAENERMVSTEEGRQLAKDLGCHMFREISVRESVHESGEVFEDLWREFSRLSPRSPSSSQRRKFSYRIQDKIPVLNSNASTCASEALKNLGVNEGISTLTHTLKKQCSAPGFTFSTRTSKESLYNDSNNNNHSDDMYDNARDIARIPEADDEDSDPATPPPDYGKPMRSRRNAVVSGSLTTKPPTFPRARRKALCKAVSVDNVFNHLDENSTTASDTTTPLSSSSTSSSTTSLNGSINPSTNSSDKLKTNDSMRVRSSSDAGQNQSDPKKAVSRNPEDLVSIYQDHCRRHRARRCESVKFKRPFNPMPAVPLTSTYEVGGF
uniref:small monomeric GTPase n=1 Tax=Phallusia mammillata TaxID=59560 RepID=A0A6F9DQY5_9ASCI|nr:ras-like protein family member 11A [Phallusia mammillata]